MIPHHHQTNYLDAVREGWKEFSKQLVVSPTGSGKTCMFSWIAHEFVKAGGKVLILVDQDELVTQTLGKVKALTGIMAGREQAEHAASLSDAIVVATQQSMVRRLDKWPENHFALVIADEADKSIAPQFLSVLKHFDGHAKVAGFTATPNRSDARNLGEYYENSVELENLKTLIKKGFLSRIKIERFPIKIDLSGLKTKGGDFSDDELDEIMTPYLGELAQAVKVHGSFRRTLVFLPLIKTCEKFNERARDIGLKSDYIYGKDPKREEKLEAFKRWDFDVLANAMLLTRGIDIPEADCGGMFRPTTSVTLYFQMAGRLTRIATGKSDAVLLDPLYQSGKNLICTPAHLVAKNQEEAEAIEDLMEAGAMVPEDVAEQFDLVDMSAMADNQREETLRRKLEQKKDELAETVTAEQFALGYNNFAVAEYQPTMSWEMRPPTEKQIKYLNKAKVDLSTVQGRGHANKLLDLYFRHKMISLASHAQRAKMKQMRYPNWEHATIGEAKKFFADLKNRSKEPMFSDM